MRDYYLKGTENFLLTVPERKIVLSGHLSEFFGLNPSHNTSAYIFS